MHVMPSNPELSQLQCVAAERPWLRATNGACMAQAT